MKEINLHHQASTISFARQVNH